MATSMVAATISRPLKSIRVARITQMKIAMATNAMAPGTRNHAPSGLFLRKTGRAAQPNAYKKRRATAERVTFHEKLPTRANTHVRIAKTIIEK